MIDSHFADIAAHLNALTHKGVPFVRTALRHSVPWRNTLSMHLSCHTHPLARNSSQFTLQTDASAVGLDTVLEHNGYVIAYANCSLTHSEKQYSTIQRECLAIVYALKQFRHYLLDASLSSTLIMMLLPLSIGNAKSILFKWFIGRDRLMPLQMLSLRSAHSLALLLRHFLIILLMNSKYHRVEIQSEGCPSPPPRGCEWQHHPFSRYVKEVNST